MLENHHCVSNLKWYIFLDCITHTDCPYGGTNYVCNANICECQIPMVLDGDKCVGMLLLLKKINMCIDCNFDYLYVSLKCPYSVLVFKVLNF